MTSKQVKAIRRRLRVTQQELANRLGVTRNTVNRWEMGTVAITEPMSRLLKIIGKEKVSK